MLMELFHFESSMKVSAIRGKQRRIKLNFLFTLSIPLHSGKYLSLQIFRYRMKKHRLQNILKNVQEVGFDLSVISNLQYRSNFFCYSDQEINIFSLYFQLFICLTRGQC